MEGYVFWAGMVGIIASISLLIGSAVGIFFRISSTVIGLLAAFGAGALLSALAIELVAPTISELATANDAAQRLEAEHHFFLLILGAVIGGLLFVLLDQLINQKGGYLRKTAYIISKAAVDKERFFKKAMKDVADVPLFYRLDPEDMSIIIGHLKPRFLHKGDIVYTRGDTPESMYVIRNGSLKVDSPDHPDLLLGKGEIVGEMSLLNKVNRTADCTAEDETELLVLSAEDFHMLREKIPEFDGELRNMAKERFEENITHVEKDADERAKWAELAMDAVHHGDTGDLPTRADLQKQYNSHGNAAFAIWLGIMLDAIPESFVLGIAVLTLVSASVAASVEPSFLDVLPYTFIAGLFLSNFPEALSSSAQMKKEGMQIWKILSLWGSLVILTAVGAAIGAFIGDGVSHSTLVLVEGLAAGAMLTMICAAMLPEAAHLADNNLVGLATLTGFLASVLFKLLE